MDEYPNLFNGFFSEKADWIIFKIDDDFQIGHDTIRARVALHMGDLNLVPKVTGQFSFKKNSGSQLKMFLT